MKPLAPLPNIDRLNSLSIEETSPTTSDELGDADLTPKDPASNDLTTNDAAADQGTEQNSPEATTQTEDQGFPPAHIWIASTLMAGDLSMDTEEERWLLMKAHADAALLLEPKNKYAQYLQIKYFEGTDQVERAVALMKKLLFEYPEFNGELMQHRLSIGEVRDAKLYARGVIRYAESNVGHEGRLLAVDYAYWSAAARLLGRMDEAALRAREGGKKFPDHPDIKKLAAVSVLTQLNRTEPTSPEFLPLLCEAHVLNKDNQLLVNRLAARLTYEPFEVEGCLLYTSPSPRDKRQSRMPSSA